MLVIIDYMLGGGGGGGRGYASLMYSTCLCKYIDTHIPPFSRKVGALQGISQVTGTHQVKGQYSVPETNSGLRRCWEPLLWSLLDLACPHPTMETA